jgi:hypothetical protein
VGEHPPPPPAHGLPRYPCFETHRWAPRPWQICSRLPYLRVRLPRPLFASGLAMTGINRLAPSRVSLRAARSNLTAQYGLLCGRGLSRRGADGTPSVWDGNLRKLACTHFVRLPRPLLASGLAMTGSGHVAPSAAEAFQPRLRLARVVWGFRGSVRESGAAFGFSTSRRLALRWFHRPCRRRARRCS